jgi:hypothetical protein
MGQYKDKFGKSRLGAFISKASEFIPELAGAGIKLATGNISGALEDVGGILNSNKENNEKSRLLLQEFKIKEMEFAKECYALEVEDREGARKVYLSDGVIQKVLAVVFTVSYFIIIKYLLDHFFNGHKLEDYQLAFVSTIFGTMSSKVNTIIDFFFGGSVNK